MKQLTIPAGIILLFVAFSISWFVYCVITEGYGGI